MRRLFVTLSGFTLRQQRCQEVPLNCIVKVMMKTTNFCYIVTEGSRRY
jgi:hypothetical protein